MQTHATDKFYLHNKTITHGKVISMKTYNSLQISCISMQQTSFIYTKHETFNFKNMIWEELLNVNRDKHGFF